MIVSECAYFVQVKYIFPFVEWQRGIEPHDDPALKGKKDPDSGD
jgi:hypothetical protein